jgi:hypothetical protein
VSPTGTGAWASSVPPLILVSTVLGCGPSTVRLCRSNSDWGACACVRVRPGVPASAGVRHSAARHGTIALMRSGGTPGALRPDLQHTAARDLTVPNPAWRGAGTGVFPAQRGTGVSPFGTGAWASSVPPSLVSGAEVLPPSLVYGV